MRSTPQHPSDHEPLSSSRRQRLPARTLKQRPREQRRNKMLAVGVGMPTLGFSSLCALGAMINLAQSFEGAMLVMLIVASAVSILSLIALTLGLRQRATTSLIMDQRTERALLELAAQAGGQLTASLLATSTDLNLEESEEALTTLARRQLAELQLRHDGSLHYLFPNMMSPAQLQQAHDDEQQPLHDFHQQLSSTRHDETTFDFGSGRQGVDDGSDGSVGAVYEQHAHARRTQKP